jgi:Flp pilus assembly pilin Flp
MVVILRDMKTIFKTLLKKDGQTMIEYVVLVVFMIATVSIMAVLLYTFKEQGGRVLDLAASEYP